MPPLGRSGPALYSLFSAFGLLLYLLSLAVSYLVAVVDHARASERRALEVQVLAREAELRMLRAQIDPHFLFNSLHSISALTVSDAAAARRMCVLLADFLRESLALGVETRITLKRELGLVARFLDVERVRYGSRLQHRIEADADADACLVPPLLLQPLVENAITHGIAHTARRRHRAGDRAASGQPSDRGRREPLRSRPAAGGRAAGSASPTCARG